MPVKIPLQLSHKARYILATSRLLTKPATNLTHWYGRLCCWHGLLHCLYGLLCCLYGLLCCLYGRLCCRFWWQIGNNLNSTACRLRDCRQLGWLCRQNVERPFDFVTDVYRAKVDLIEFDFKAWYTLLGDVGKVANTGKPTKCLLNRLLSSVYHSMLLMQHCLSGLKEILSELSVVFIYLLWKSYTKCREIENKNKK